MDCNTDTVHGAFTGFVVGGIVGVLAGALLVNFPPGGITLDLVAVLVAAIVGAGVGTWIASMVGMQVPNSRLTGFDPATTKCAASSRAPIPRPTIAAASPRFPRFRKAVNGV